MQQAQSAEFPQPLDSHVFDAMSNQQSLVTSFEGVLKLIKPLVKIGDEIAKVCSLVFPVSDDQKWWFFQKIHPYVNLAWTVLSAGMKASYVLLL